MHDDDLQSAQSRAFGVPIMDRLYRQHREGAVVRTGASAAMWLTAIPAHLVGMLDGTQFRGITLAVAFLALMNLPLLWLARRLKLKSSFERLSIAVHGLEVLGYTAIIHFVGGIDAAFLTVIYCGLIAYVGVVAPRRHLYLVAAMSGFAFTALVMLEHLGVLASYPLFSTYPGARPPWVVISVILAVVGSLLFVVAIISAYSSGLLRKSQEHLRLRKEQLQREVEARKQTEARLRELVDEKQLLLKEVHHRVKNNLQVMSSLLRLQADGIQDDRTRAALLTSHGRVNSMAMVHEVFYQSGDLHRVDLDPFLRSLAAHLVSAYDFEHSPLELRITADSVQVDLDTAIRVGLAANELVSNALRHAFPERDTAGLLDIEMRVDANSAELTVADDGRGLPPGFDWTATDSLGLQLVQNLARQLRGSVTLDTANGTAFHLRFPIASEPAASADSPA
jgi:two-component sensor histidine kinase